MYQAIFSRRAERAFMTLSNEDAGRIKTAILRLQNEPRCYGTIKLENAPVASYRHRVGNWRILFDINNKTNTIEILDIKRRSERTYK